MINSQRGAQVDAVVDSISKGMGDQFSADTPAGGEADQYIKGDG